MRTPRSRRDIQGRTPPPAVLRAASRSSRGTPLISHLSRFVSAKAMSPLQLQNGTMWYPMKRRLVAYDPNMEASIIVRSDLAKAVVT
jgi:hypothetical protein